MPAFPSSTLPETPKPGLTGLRARWNGVQHRQRGRSGNWVAVLFGLGAAVFFAVPDAMPDWPLAMAGAGLCGVLAIVAARNSLLARWLPPLSALFHCGFWFLFGAGLMLLRVAALTAPAPDIGSEPQTLRFHVVDAARNARGFRVNALLDQPFPSRPYATLSLTANNADLVTPGAALRCRVILRPLRDPRLPGDFDEARFGFFRGMGAAGFALGRCASGGYAPPDGLMARVEVMLARFKATLARAAATRIGGAEGAFAAGLLVGDRSLLTFEDAAMFRASGLAHLLAVSGMNMWLLGGAVMFVLRWALGGWAILARHIPAQKTAAFGALLACTAYLAICGPSAATLRAFVMAAIALVAILIGRRAISMRGLAIAALIVLILRPESAIDPGFHMSFAASAALVALYESQWARPTRDADLPPGFAESALRFVALSFATSLVAGAATAPAATYTFHQAATWGFFANIAAAPILTFIITPAALVSLVLSPFGWEAMPVAILRAGLYSILVVGRAVASAPFAVAPVGVFPGLSFLLLTLALYWACLWRGVLRLGALPLALAALLWAHSTALTGIFRADGEIYALRTPDGPRSFAAPRQRRALADYREALGLPLDLPLSDDQDPPPATIFSGLDVVLIHRVPAGGTRQSRYMPPPGPWRQPAAAQKPDSAQEDF